MSTGETLPDVHQSPLRQNLSLLQVPTGYGLYKCEDQFIGLVSYLEFIILVKDATRS